MLANNFYNNLINNKTDVVYNQLDKSVSKIFFASALSGYNEYGKITNIKIYSIETERADSSTLDVKYFIRLKVTHGKEVTFDALEFTNNRGSIKLLHHGFIPHSNMRPDPDISESDL